jgi:hypothetical protein
MDSDEAQENGDNSQQELIPLPEVRRKVMLTEIPVRMILTPFPARDVKGRKEYRREFRDGTKVFAMTLKSMVPETSEDYGRLMGDDLIPTGEIGRNLHAIIMGDVRRAMMRHGEDTRTVIYQSIKDIADRIRVSYQPKNIRRIESILYRFAWLSLIYEQNSKVVSLPSTGTTTARLTMFAEGFQRELYRGDVRRFEMRVSLPYMKTMGERMTTVNEDVYMGIQSSFAKDLYAWMVYGSKWAAAKGVPTFEADLERIVRQLTETELSRDNVGYYKAETRKRVGEIIKLDPSLDASLEGNKLVVKAREPKAQIQDASGDNVTEVPAPGIVETGLGNGGEYPTAEETAIVRSMLSIEEIMKKSRLKGL